MDRAHSHSPAAGTQSDSWCSFRRVYCAWGMRVPGWQRFLGSLCVVLALVPSVLSLSRFGRPLCADCLLKAAASRIRSRVCGVPGSGSAFVCVCVWGVRGGGVCVLSPGVTLHEDRRGFMCGGFRGIGRHCQSSPALRPAQAPPHPSTEGTGFSELPLPPAHQWVAQSQGKATPLQGLFLGNGVGRRGLQQLLCSSLKSSHRISADHSFSITSGHSCSLPQGVVEMNSEGGPSGCP